MKYLAIVVSAGGFMSHAGSVGVFRWRWLAHLAAWWFKDTYDLGPHYKTQIWPIPKEKPARLHERKMSERSTCWECSKCETTWVWDGSFAPSWLWSKRPCLDCVCDAKAQGHEPPRKKIVGATISFSSEEMVLDFAAEALEGNIPPERVQKMVSDGPPWKVSPEEYRKAQEEGLVPKWRPPCATCGTNCGQCASGHCAVCGAKSQFPKALVHDPVMHAAFEASKCGKCGKHGAHFCLDGKEAGLEYLAKNSYPKGEKDVHGEVVNR